MEKSKEVGRQIVAGGSAGLVEVCIMQPLDVAKTRLQMGKSQYSGLVDVFKKTLHNEGIRGFYKGIVPPVLAETPKRAIKFFTFRQYSDIFVTNHLPLWSTVCIAGFCSGLTEAIAITPFESVKVRLQADTSPSKKCTATVAREIIRKHGIFGKGLYRGFSAMCYREGIWNMFYFGIYHNAKYLVPDEMLNPTGNLAGRLFLGFCSGTIASTINITFDVAKSRIQALAHNDPAQRYHRTWQTIQLIRKEEGATTLFRGLVPKVLRLGPGGAIMLLVFDKVYEWLKIHT